MSEAAPVSRTFLPQYRDALGLLGCLTSLSASVVTDRGLKVNSQQPTVRA